jgi:hypothetical protein
LRTPLALPDSHFTSRANRQREAESYYPARR